MSDDLKNSPAKSSKIKKIFIGVAGIFFGIMVLGLVFGDNETSLKTSGNESKISAESPQSSTTNVEATMAVTATELFNSFRDNEVAAKEKYGNGSLAISGTISDITLDMFDSPVVSFRTPNEFMSLQASGLRTEAAKNLKKGSKVTVICGEISEVAGTPMASDCSLK